MVTHVVLFTPRSALPTHAREALIDAFACALRDIPTVRGVRIGRRVLHGAGYEQLPPPFDYFVSIEFDDVAGLQSYLQHDAHSALGARFGETISAAAVYDYETGGPEKLREFL